MKRLCENCYKLRVTKTIYIDLDKTEEKWCQSCRANYEKDSKVLSKK